MIEKAATLHQINVYDETNDLNVDNVDEQWDLRSCMHPGIVDQTDNGLSVEKEWNILIIEQSDEDDEDSDDGVASLYHIICTCTPRTYTCIIWHTGL